MKIEKKERLLNSKKGIEIDMIGWIILAIAFLVLFVAGMIILKDKGFGALDFIKNLFRFGT